MRKIAVREVYVGRQPIVDRELTVLGYELLFRHGPHALRAATDDDRATGRIIVNTFAELGLQRLVGSRLGFINVTRPFLVGTLPLPFAPTDVVLEILETVVIDDDLLDGVRRLRAGGYRLALDDFRADDAERVRRLLPLVDYVKVDVLDQSPSAIARSVEYCRKCSGARPPALIAERVESLPVMRDCVNLGFSYFQGYLLGRPATVSSPTLSPATVTCMELLNRLAKPDITYDELEEIVRMDVGLSYRVLRAVNSAAAGLVRPISSVREALVLLGHRQLRAWVLLMVLADASDIVEEQLSVAMTRARMCELLTAYLPGANPDAAFLTGLLSSLDFLLGVPMTEVVARLPLDDTIARALVDGEGPLGEIVRIAKAYEVADLETLALCPVDLADLAPAYLNALAWSMATVGEAVTA